MRPYRRKGKEGSFASLRMTHFHIFDCWQELLGFDRGGEDRIAALLDFDGDGGAHTGSADDIAADGCVHGAAVTQQIEEALVAWIGDQRMVGAIAVDSCELPQIRDVFEAAGAVWLYERKSPITAPRQVHDHRGNVCARECVVEDELLTRPGLRKLFCRRDHTGRNRLGFVARGSGLR